MAGQIGIRDRPKVDIPDCPDCKVSLRFDYIGKVIDYCNGFKTILVCNKCKKGFTCENGKVLENG